MKRTSTAYVHILALVVVVATLWTVPVRAATLKQGTFPPCPGQGTYYLTPSPAYSQDYTLFLASARPGVVWRSNDAGETWSTVLDMSRFDGYTFGSIAMVPTPPNPKFSFYQSWTYSTSPSLEVRMLWYSDDSGATWTSRQPSPGMGIINVHPVVVSYLAKAFSLENTSPDWPSRGIWRFYYPTFWEKVWDGTEALFLAISPDFEQDGTLYASLVDRSLLLGSPVIESTDGGETWEGRGGNDLCDQGAGSVQLSSSFGEDRTLFVHQASSLFKSQNAGETWSVVFPRDRPHCQGGVLAPTVDSYKLSSTFGQDHTLYVVTTGPSDDDYRLLVSSDGGATWTFQSSVSRSTSLLWVLPAAAGSNGVEEVQAVAPGPLPTAPESASSSPGASRAVAPDSDRKTFLPLVDWTAAQPTARPFTLFIDAWNGLDGWAYYRSDDGGVTWTCMQLPPVQPPERTQFLGRGR